MPEIIHPILTPHGITVFVGGCRRRGEGSRFRAKAHTHHDEKVICYLSTKWLTCRELALHELAHVFTGMEHNDKWRAKVIELGGTIKEVPGILKSYEKKTRVIL